MQLLIMVDGVQEYVSDIADVVGVDIVQNFGDKTVAGKLDHVGMDVLTISVDVQLAQPVQQDEGQLEGQTKIA